MNWRTEKHLRDCEMMLPPYLIDSDNVVVVFLGGGLVKFSEIRIHLKMCNIVYLITVFFS